VSRSRWLRILSRTLIALLAFIVVSFVALQVASDPLPDGQSGADADALAHAIERAVRLDAWNATGAVRWTFAGRNRHLWDKARGLHHVRWGDHEVVLQLGSQKGCARSGGALQSGERAQALVDKAYALWVNDSFWLNPLGKLFDPGVVRKRVSVEGRGEGLLITFTANGLTPGDSYLWWVDAQGLPNAWQMWTVIPIGGLETSWDGWIELETGARISTRHEIWGMSLELGDVAGASTLDGLLGSAENPFDWCKVW
jgi:hypothetical protein